MAHFKKFPLNLWQKLLTEMLPAVWQHCCMQAGFARIFFVKCRLMNFTKLIVPFLDVSYFFVKYGQHSQI